MAYRRRRFNRRKLRRRAWKASIGGSGWGFKANATLERRMHRVAKQEILKTEGVKIATQFIPLTGFTQNTMYSTAPTQAITIGTGSNQRIGQNVFIKSISLQGLVANSPSFPLTKFRFIVAWLENKYLITSGTWSAAGVQNADLFYNNGAQLSFAMLNHQTGISVICDRTISVNTQYTGETVVKKFNVTCKINRKYIYDPGSTLFKDRQLYVCVVPYSPGGTGTVGSLECTTLVSYVNA